MKRIHTFDELRDESPPLQGPDAPTLRRARSHREAAPKRANAGPVGRSPRGDHHRPASLPEDVAEMRSTIHQLDQSQPAHLRGGHMACTAELVRLRSETDQSLSGKLKIRRRMGPPRPIRRRRSPVAWEA